MTESAQTKPITPVDFDNLLLKQWLHSIGPARRCEVLRKLKAHLQDLGLSKKQVHRGLIQLATKPRVILVREPPAKRYGPRRLFIDENEDKSSAVTASFKTDATIFQDHSQTTLQHVQKSDVVEVISEKQCKRNEVDDTRSCKVEPKSNLQEVLEPSKDRKFEATTQPTLRSFDKALEQLDMLDCAKMNTIEKLIGKKNSVSPESRSKWRDYTNNKKSPSSTKSMCNKDNNVVTHIQKDVNPISGKAIGSKSDEAVSNNTLLQDKKNRVKVNLSSCSKKKGADTKADFTTNKVKHSTQEKGGNKINSHHGAEKGCVNHANGKTGSERKRKLLDTFPEDLVQGRNKIYSKGDSPQMITRRKKRKLHKFRRYFGNCLSISEDEQEQTILHKNCKRRKEKDSVDSCDSGVCFNEGSAANWEGKSEDAQTTVPDRTMREECNEDTSKQAPVETNTRQEEKNTNENDKRANGTENTTNIAEIKNASITAPEMSTSTKAESNKSNNSTAEADTSTAKADTSTAETNTLLEKDSKDSNETIQRISGNHGVIQNVFTEYAKETLRRMYHEDSEPSMETEMRISPLSCDALETSNGDIDIQNLSTTDFSDIQEDNLNNHDINELLQMSFEDTCQITTNGNVLSIQEDNAKDINQNTVKEASSTDENSNLNKFAEIKGSSSNEKKNSSEPLRETVIRFDTRDLKTASINNTMCNMCDNVNETIPEKPQSKNTTEEGNQHNQGSQARLRVLSSAELGSRWCPTPVHPATYCIDLSLNNLSKFVAGTPESLPRSAVVSQTVSTVSTNFSKSVTITSMPVATSVPAATSVLAATSVPAATSVSLSQPEPATCAPTFTVPASAPTSAPASTGTTTAPLLNSTLYNPEAETSEAVHNALVALCTLIEEARSSSQIPVTNYDKSLCSEFEKLRKLMSPTNFLILVHGTLHLINKRVFISQPLTIQELFYYTPSLRSLYAGLSSRQISSANESYYNMYRNLNGTITVVNKPTLQQNVQRNHTSLQTGFQDSVITNAMSQECPVHFNQMTASAKPVQRPQTFVEKAVTPPRNVNQNNAPMTNMNPPPNKQPSKSRKQGQKSTAQPKTKQKPAPNVNVAQSVPKQQQTPNPTINVNQPGSYVCVPTTNAYVNQPYLPHNGHMSNINAYYTMNTAPATTYLVGQNINSAYTIQQQQNVNFLYNVKQPNMNVKHTHQSQNINPANQQFQQTVLRPPSFTAAHGPPPTHGTQLPQSVPIMNYPPQKIFGPTGHQLIPRNAQQNEQIYQKAPLQPQMKVPQNIPLESKALVSSSHSKNVAKSITENKHLHSKDRASKTGNTLQVSLESMARDFNILRYLSKIQKIILLQQLKFYFGCTTWLEKQYSHVQWQRIQSERTKLLSCHTILTNIVDKIMNDQQVKNQSNVCKNNSLPNNIKIDASELKITVQGTAVHCKVDVSNVEKIQSEVTEKESQQNLNVLITRKEPEQEPKKTSTSENTQYPSQLQNAENTVADQKADETCIEKNTVPQLLSLLETVLRNTKNSEYGIRKKTQETTKTQHLDDIVKVPDSSSCIVEDAALDLEESNKDISQQLNSHLVTVEISPDSDHVMVVDVVNGSQEVTDNVPDVVGIKTIRDNSEYSQEEKFNSSARDSSPKLLTKGLDTNSEYSQDVEIMEEEKCSAQIADVRSISLEAFEGMGIGSSISAIVEEEEIKVCLCCSKLSTVVCSICLEAKYCSKNCSELHWREHYKSCKPVEESVYL